jgi:hypothetical protein
MRKLREQGLVKLQEEYPHSFYQIDARLCKEFAQRIKPIDDMFLHP